MGDLTLELLRWLESRPRTYPEAIEAWRSNCPRDPVWDDALTAGLVRVAPSSNGMPAAVELTAQGRALLDG